MIPERRLLKSLINIHTNKDIKHAIKHASKTINYKKKKQLYCFTNNLNESSVFYHFISLDGYLNNYQLNDYYSNIIDFHFLLTGFMPIFEFQELTNKNHQEIQKTLQTHALTNPNISKWYQESQTKITSKLNLNLNFLLKNDKIPEWVKTSFLVLTHISGKFFETLKNNDYELGYYFMLFYLINLETKQTLIFKSNTNWNLKSYFTTEDFFTYKLKIIDKFSQVLMNTKGQKFNLYLRVINAFINKNSE